MKMLPVQFFFRRAKVFTGLLLVCLVAYMGYRLFERLI
jgi:hypothetical protein